MNEHTINLFYEFLWPDKPDEKFIEFLTQLDKPLEESPNSFLFDILDEFAVNLDSTILDVGCGPAKYACLLAERYSAVVTGIDPVEHNIKLATTRIAEKKQSDKVSVLSGFMENIPCTDNSFDWIWCKDTLSHCHDLKTTFSEFSRVLMPKGRVLIYTAINTQLMSGDEKRYFERILGNCINAMALENINEALRPSNLNIIISESVDDEQSKYKEPLMDAFFTRTKHLAKLIRNERAYTELLGSEQLEIYKALCLFSNYCLIGKVNYQLMVLEKA